jgi:hypothetical protein
VLWGRRRRGLRTGYFARGLRTSSRSTPHVGVAIRGCSFFHFLGVGSPGRWVVWALGEGQGRPRGAGCWALGALGRRRRGLRTGHFSRGLRTLSRSTPEVGVAIRGGSFFPSCGRWVARALGREGVGCAAGSPPGSQVDDEAISPELRYPVRKLRSGTSRRYSHRRYGCPIGPAIAERWVARALGHQGVGWHGPPVGRWVI